MPQSKTTIIEAPSVLEELSVREFLASLAARTPTPGGGSMTALVAALAASQLQMVIAYTRGKPRFSTFEAILTDYDNRLMRAGEVLRELMQEDKAAYEALNPFMKLPAAQRAADPAYPAVVAAAIRIPQAVAATAANIIEAAEFLHDKVNRMLISDLGVAAAMAMAAMESAELNVLVNLPLLENPVSARDIALSLIHLRDESRRRYSLISEKLRKELSTSFVAALPIENR
jgi:formiminotetrahydrofolate cyclodeaminase